MTEGFVQQGAASGSWREGGRSAWLKPELWLPLALLLVAFATGGSSAGQPIRDMTVELCSLVVLAAAVAGLFGRTPAPDTRLPLILLAGVAGLVIFQIIPLPGSIWSRLAGRQISSEVLGLIGANGGSHPISVQPDQTVAAALGMLPGVAMALAAMRLGRSSRLVLAWSCVALALASFVLGGLQVGLLRANVADLTFYKTSHRGLPIGVFANTNHQADLLVIGFVMAGVLAQARARGTQSWMDKPYWVYGIMIALAIGVVATGSRTGIALLGVGFGALMLRERVAGHVRSFLIGAAGLAAALVALVMFNPVFYRSFADFSDLDDPRFRFWPNVMWAIGEFGWTGTGLGTFEDVYRSAETLETLSPRFLNHAHNDYLELALETGIPGLILLTIFFGWLVWRAVKIIRGVEAEAARGLAYAALVCAGVLLMHSGVDYPLRTPLLCAIFGLCCGLISGLPADASLVSPSNPSRGKRRLLGFHKSNMD